MQIKKEKIYHLKMMNQKAADKPAILLLIKENSNHQSGQTHEPAQKQRS